MTMLPHAQAHSEARAAVDALVLTEQLPSLGDRDREYLARYAMAVSALETSYGYGWSAEHGAGSNNMGAITAGSSWGGATFDHADSTPTTQYVTQFRAYPTRAHGWEDLVRLLFRRDTTRTAAIHGDTRGVAQSMYDARYYTGTSTTPAVNVDRYTAGLTRHLASADAVIGPASPGGTALVPPIPFSSLAESLTLVGLVGLAGYAVTRIVRGRSRRT